jgi:alpha-beta hydrolase superfamily lysophospholipase
MASGPMASGRRRRPWLRWLVWGLAGLASVVIAAVVLFVVLTRNPSPGSFYAVPADVPAEPGTLIRAEPFTAGVPAGARAWRVLYSSTSVDGEPIAVSGLILAPNDAPRGPRPVLAWAHGTLGVVPACAPSLSDAPLAGIPDLSGPLAKGWVIAMTDYPGLGTPGPHPYLVGVSEGRSVLDSVRAAHRLDLDLEVGDPYAIWGHSQGGHAALFAGQLAPTYLPEYRLVGVAALSPATFLEADLAAIEGTRAGNILTILALASWSRYYPGISDEILTDDARRTARQIAGACLNQPSRFRIVVAGLRLPDRVVDVDVTDDPAWADRLEQNSPSPRGVKAPLFVGQGLMDVVISPAVTTSWVARRCATGAQVEYRTYPDVTHPAVVGPGGTDAFVWTNARFAGTAPADTCAFRVGRESARLPAPSGQLVLVVLPAGRAAVVPPVSSASRASTSASVPSSSSAVNCASRSHVQAHLRSRLRFASRA